MYKRKNEKDISEWIPLAKLVSHLPAPFPKSRIGVRSFIFEKGNNIEYKILKGKTKWGDRIYVSRTSLNKFLQKELKVNFED